MVYGTDLLGPMHRHQLLEFSIRSAFQSASEVIASATVTAAELFNMTEEIGDLSAGKRADVIALAGNPLEDLGVLQRPDECLKLVMKDGVIYKNDYAVTDNN